MANTGYKSPKMGVVSEKNDWLFLKKTIKKTPKNGKQGKKKMILPIFEKKDGKRGQKA